MNKKKAILLISGAVAATSGFLLYQFITGSEWTNKVTPPKPPSTNQYMSGFRLEMKDADGGESLITAESLVPLSTQGQYHATKFRVEWSLGNNQKIVLESDAGDVESSLDVKGKPQKFKKLDLSGNVTITFGPSDSFEATSTKPGATQIARPVARKANQLQIKFKDGKDPAHLKYDGVSRLLTSDDAVAVASEQVTFSGKGLLLAINQQDKRIELLRIAEGEKINLKPDAQGNIKFGFAATRPAAEVDGLHLPATKPASVAATKPKKAPTQYLLDFSDNIKIVHGDMNFEGKQLQLTAFDEAKDIKTKPASAPAATKTVAATQNADGPGKNLKWDPKLETNITWTGPLVVRPVRDLTAEEKAKGDRPDFKVANLRDVHVEVFGTDEKPVDAKWGDSRLVAKTAIFDVLPGEDGNKETAEVVFDAVGTAKYPASIEDGKSFARGGHIHFRKNTREGVIEKGDYKEAEVQYFNKDALVFSANHPKIVVGENLAKIDLDGPGRATFAADMFEAGAEAKANAKKTLTDITFSEGLHAATSTIANAKDPSKPHLVWKNVSLVGASTVAHPSLNLQATKSIDLVVAHSLVEKNGALEVRHELDNIVALGGVTAKFARKDLTLADKDSPDTIESDSIEVLTKQIAGSRQIDEIRFKREGTPVVALLHTNEKNDKGEVRVLTQRVEAPAITAFLNPKIKSAATAPATGVAATNPANDFNVNIREIIATGGVKATIEGISGMVASNNAPLIATAGELHAYPKPNNASTIELIAQKTVAGLTPVKLAVGKNFVEGNVIHLDQAAQSIFIPGQGQFYFVSEPDKTKPEKDQIATPYHMKWEDRKLADGKIEQSSMSFDQKKSLAVIKGDINATSQGAPGKKSLLKTNALTVELLSSAERKSTSQPADRFALKSFTAEGNVLASGESYEPGTQNLLTKQEIKSQKLTYTNDKNIAQSPGAGEIFFIDLRPPEIAEAKKAATQPANPLGGANMRGGARITWQGTLTYNGDAGQIDLTKDVVLKFQPTENTKGGTSIAANTMTRLDTAHLGVKIDTSKSEKNATAADPAGLGAFKVTSFVADGGATLIRGPASMSGDVLAIDPVKNTARADGNVIVSPDKNTSSKMQSFTWDLSKEGNAFEIGNTVIRSGGG